MIDQYKRLSDSKRALMTKWWGAEWVAWAEALPTRRGELVLPPVPAAPCPPCFAAKGPESFGWWLEAARYCGEPMPHCRDCTRSGQLEMAMAGRCDQVGKVFFVRLKDAEPEGVRMDEPLALQYRAHWPAGADAEALAA